MSDGDQRRRTFLLGLKDALGLPAVGLIAALSGYGVMARNAGFDLLFALTSVLTVWAMPVLMGFVELVEASASPWLLFVTLLAIAFRNMPMSVSAIPMIREKPGFRLNQLLMAQLLAPTAWVQITVIGRTLKPRERMPYYVGFSLTLLLAGMLGAWMGFSWTQGLPPVVGLSLLMLTPLFVIMIMATSPKLSSRLALVAGGVGVPFFMQWDTDWGLILGGLLCGTLGFLVSRSVRGKELA